MRVIEGGHLDSPIQPTDRTRREKIDDDHVVLELRYRLNEKDRDAVKELYEAGAQLPQWFTVTKTAGGGLRFSRTANPDGRGVSARRPDKRWRIPRTGALSR